MACSAPVAVMIFIVEPGGCSAEKAIPASASSAPVRGFMTTIPAYCPPSAATAARSIAGAIVVLTGWAGTGATEASVRCPASSCPPGLPARRFWKTRSSPSSPTWALAG